MRRLPALRLTALALVAGLSLTSCGDDEVFPRAEFIQQVTTNGLTEPVADCAYDRIKDNETIMKELVRAGGPNDNISEKVSAELTPILARCLLAAEDQKSGTTTTTTKKGSSTTEKSSEKTTTTKKK